ncbi:isochorismatase family protein [Streptomonospora wellingtoniae]|uniref:Isochorismatase family protein n=1 Tax=Streptomonospora wellingtoniae TaxID=3075544 RepID=A0ABU2KNI3_9ACTN|nr:isochorismatase family protein [Streptomonospora sp. DSM 45055]MDT0300829.1 isochorismatase family protein [Streptomonospora sp. DSM 45055]
MHDPAFADAVAATGRRNLILAGVTNDVRTVFPALTALEQGYRVQVIADAGGSMTTDADDIALGRMERAGVDISSTNQILPELAGSWASERATPAAHRRRAHHPMTASTDTPTSGFGSDVVCPGDPSSGGASGIVAAQAETRSPGVVAWTTRVPLTSVPRQPQTGAAARRSSIGDPGGRTDSAMESCNGHGPKRRDSVGHSQARAKNDSAGG